MPVSFRPTKRESIYLGSLALVAVVIQLAAMPAQPGGPDMTTYVAIAKDELTQPGFWSNPESFVGNFWAMAYPTFLAVMNKLTGEDLTWVLALQVVMAASLVVVPWILATRLPKVVQLGAPAVLALSPALWWMGTTIGYEVLLAWLLCFSLALAWMAYERGAGTSPKAQAVLGAVSGLLLAGALLTQTRILAVLPVIAYLLYRGGRWALASGALGFVVGLAPWMARNVVVLGTPSPLTGNAGYNLWVGSNPEAINGGSMLVAPPVPAGETMMSAAIQFIISQPERWIELTWIKAARMLEPVFLYPTHLPVGAPRTLLHLYAGALGLVLAVGVILFVGARVVAGARNVPAVTPLAFFWVLWFAAHLPFIAEPRYMTSIAPVTVVVGLATWAWIWGRARGGQRGIVGHDPKADHEAVKELERRGLPTSLDLSVPGWRAARITTDTRLIAPSQTITIPAQPSGLPEEQHSWPEFNARTLTGCVLDVDSGLAFTDGRVIAQSGSGTRASRDAAFVSGATFRITDTTPESISGPVAALGDIHHHYHVMIETLPRMLHARDYCADVTFVTSEQVSERYRVMFDSLNLEVKTISAGTVLAPESLVLVDQPELFWPRPADIAAIRKAFSNDAEPLRSIYVSRRNAARSIENESDLEREMESRGFTTVLLEDMTIQQQIELFASTRTVVAPHGAGLTGIAFMAPGTTVIEITSGEVFENCYRRIAAISDLDYTMVHISSSASAPYGAAVDAIDAIDAAIAG